MATSNLAYQLIAREYGVDAADPAQVDDFFALRAPELPPAERGRIFDVLVACDGLSDTELCGAFPKLWSDSPSHPRSGG